MGSKPAAKPDVLETPEIHVLSRIEILDATDYQRELVEVPEWGGSVWVQSMSGTERDSYEAELVGSGDNDDQAYNLFNLRAKLACRSLVDEAGKKLFSEAEIAVLGEKDAYPLERVCAVARRLSRLRKTDVTVAKINLGKGQSGSSGTG